MDPQETPIQWKHFVLMHEKDKTMAGQLRVCPKLSGNHLTLNNSAKMRVRLAVQVYLVMNHYIDTDLVYTYYLIRVLNKFFLFNEDNH